MDTIWLSCIWLTRICAALAVAAAVVLGIVSRRKKTPIQPFQILVAGVFASAFFLFFAVARAQQGHAIPTAVLLSIFYAMQMFMIGTDHSQILENLTSCPEYLQMECVVWTIVLYTVAASFTFLFLLSLFKNVTAAARYRFHFFRSVYGFSALNEKSLALAKDVHTKHPWAIIVFTNLDDKSEELVEKAKHLGAICFQKDILSFGFGFHCPGVPIKLFAIHEEMDKNAEQALALIRKYRRRDNTDLYVFSDSLSCELALNTADKGKLLVRRINEAQAMVDHQLWSHPESIFPEDLKEAEGEKQICALVVGLGKYGMEMFKALTWYTQMDGYRTKLHAFDSDKAAEDRFAAIAPELMSEAYNRKRVFGEAQYDITIHSGMQVQTQSFSEALKQLGDVTYVFVSLGSDALNVTTAIWLRMLFARWDMHPVIQAVVYHSEKNRALQGIQNHKDQSYDIDFVGSMESTYCEDVIFHTAMEQAAMGTHNAYTGLQDKAAQKQGRQAFWKYEYNYRSSLASAIHRKARVQCRIPGADKYQQDRTAEETACNARIEHCRWNAYMRAEGYVHRETRNDLAKTHPSLVCFDKLQEGEVPKDEAVSARTTVG